MDLSKSIFAEVSAAAAGAVSSEVSTAKKLVDLILEMGVKYGFQALGGILILIVGWLIARVAAKLVADLLTKRKVDVTVSKFLVNIARVSAMALAFLLALSKFGIEVTPLIAGLSVAGVGISLALQGTLSNYAAGTSLIFTKPFKVGDIIEVAGVVGEVKDISLGRTELTRVDGARIVIPNKHIIGEIIQNYSHLKKVDLKIGVGYGSDVQKAMDTIREVIRKDPRASATIEPSVGISEFGDSSINLSASLWCKQADYLSVLFEMNQGIFEAFKRNKIEIPFPRRDVHLYKEDVEQAASQGVRTDRVLTRE